MFIKRISIELVSRVIIELHIYRATIMQIIQTSKQEE